MQKVELLATPLEKLPSPSSNPFVKTSFLTKLISRLSVAYLSGRQSASGQLYGAYNQDDVNALRALAEEPGIIYIFLTNEWPSWILNRVPPFDAPPGIVDLSSSDSTTSELVVEMKPRYHIAGTKGTFYACEPYVNIDAVHVTCFLRLAPVGNPDKQVMSMLGNSYPTGGPLSQNHVEAVNNINSMGMLNDVNSNDGAPFDINDFPQLTSRPSSAGGPQRQLGSMRKQGLGVGPIVQQNQEFSIQNEDFPALPGFKGGNAEFSMDMHQKEQLHDNGVSMMLSQHFSMGRSAGFNLGGRFSSHRSQ